MTAVTNDLDLDLLIEKYDDGYRARVIHPPGGRQRCSGSSPSREHPEIPRGPTQLSLGSAHVRPTRASQGSP
jgi:hypothetical protein